MISRAMRDLNLVTLRLFEEEFIRSSHCKLLPLRQFRCAFEIRPDKSPTHQLACRLAMADFGVKGVYRAQSCLGWAIVALHKAKLLQFETIPAGYAFHSGLARHKIPETDGVGNRAIYSGQTRQSQSGLPLIRPSPTALAQFAGGSE